MREKGQENKANAPAATGEGPDAISTLTFGD